MSYFEEYALSFDKDIVSDYFNIIGLDESEINCERFKGKNLRLKCLTDLYEFSRANKFLLSSSRDVGMSFELLMSQINDDFMHESEEEKEKIKEVSYEIINEVSLLQVSDELDSYTIFQRTNELLNTIISGLNCCDNIPSFKMISENYTPEQMIKHGLLNKENPLPLRKLYGLVALSKFKNSDIDYQIFDSADKIDEKKLFYVLNELISRKEEYSFLGSEEGKCLTKRPSFKALKELTDYRRM